MVKTLLENGADPDEVDFTDGPTPLECAVAKGDLETTKVLVDHTAYIDLIGANTVWDKHGTCPLLIAARRKGGGPIARMLPEKGLIQFV